MEMKKRILVAPLNWGLGHATRCIPIINALLEHNFEPIIASDGIALELLNKEFPQLESIELPSYNITYSKKGKNFKFKLIKDSPKWIKAIKSEKKLVKKNVEENKIDGIISDNRLGVYNKNVPCVFISHQLNVLSGSTSWFSSKMHQKIIKKFSECWVPDVDHDQNLSGKLGHLSHNKLNVKYIGPLSRFNKVDCSPKYDLLVLLSGPEPQRTILEKKLLKELKTYKGNTLFVRGIISKEQSFVKEDHITILNYMISDELEMAINECNLVLSRSGYTTIMDLSKLEKKAFFIPTPGQFEQEYLAKRLDKLRLVPCASQKEFKIEMLQKINNYYGLSSLNYEVSFKKLFSLFECKREFTTHT